MTRSGQSAASGRVFGGLYVAALALAVLGSACTHSPVSEGPRHVVILTGPGVPGSRPIHDGYLWQVAVEGLRDDDPKALVRDHWARSLGPRYRLQFRGAGTYIRALFHPYADVGFAAPFLFIPPGQRWPDGSPVPTGWMRVSWRFADALGLHG